MKELLSLSLALLLSGVCFAQTELNVKTAVGEVNTTATLDPIGIGVAGTDVRITDGTDDVVAFEIVNGGISLDLGGFNFVVPSFKVFDAQQQMVLECIYSPPAGGTSSVGRSQLERTIVAGEKYALTFHAKEDQKE